MELSGSANNAQLAMETPVKPSRRRSRLKMPALHEGIDKEDPEPSKVLEDPTDEKVCALIEDALTNPHDPVMEHNGNVSSEQLLRCLQSMDSIVEEDMTTGEITIGGNNVKTVKKDTVLKKPSMTLKAKHLSLLYFHLDLIYCIVRAKRISLCGCHMFSHHLVNETSLSILI